MPQDFYNTLGISKNASQDEIQKAYRKLAQKYHPDLNPEDKTAQDKFKEVQNAYDVLSDQEKREKYDRFGSNFEQMGGGPGAGGGGFNWTGQQGDVEFDLGDIFGGGGGPGGFSDIFSQFTGGQGRSHRRRSAPQRGADIQHAVTVPFKTAIDGGEVQLSVRRQNGKVETLTAKIPAGIQGGKKIRLKGQGEKSPNNGPSGDILITVNVDAHRHFSRSGNNLELKVPISLAEAILGGKIDVPTPHGTITLTVPPGSSSGKRLRIRGQGVKPTTGEPGDLYAELQITLPETIDPQLKEMAEQWSTDQPESPREELKW